MGHGGERVRRARRHCCSSKPAGPRRCSKVEPETKLNLPGSAECVDSRSDTDTIYVVSTDCSGAASLLKADHKFFHFLPETVVRAGLRQECRSLRRLLLQGGVK
jgi:hypothetical protein